MSTGDLLSIDPQEIQFPFELKKQISCSLQLKNNTKIYVAFKVKTTNPKKYCVQPNTGVVLPHSTCDVIVTMQAQREAPRYLQCKDKFLLQSVVTNPETTTKDVTSEMFNKDSGNYVEEMQLRVVYVSPPRPPSPVRRTNPLPENSQPPEILRSISLKMRTRDLLSIDPQELQFPFELKKHISCSLQLKNNTENYVAFKVKTTSPKKYCVRPNIGVVLPHSTCDVIVQQRLGKPCRREHVESCIRIPSSAPIASSRRWQVAASD